MSSGSHSHSHPPMRAGVLLALLAAVAFGGATPIIARASQMASPLSTAALLYAGAALAALLLGVSPSRSAPLRRKHLPRVALVALLGAGIAPVALVAGLARTGATTGSLLLNFEALFTVLLAWIFFREPIGRRVALALSLMTAAGVLLAWESLRNSNAQTVSNEGGRAASGLLLIALATLAWAADNALSRPLSEVRALSVVAAKGLLGAGLTCVLALLLHQPWPALREALILLACGATGYGLSLALYLRAQGEMGAGRTASIFAVAPFIGAALSIALGHALPGPALLAAAALFAVGVYLHLTEHHAHRHAHEHLAHEHAHRHDDAHHGHAHAEHVEGEHSHAHLHDGVVHEHEHAPDAHHHHLHR